MPAAFVQGNIGSNASTNSLSVAFSTNNTLGNCIVVDVVVLAPFAAGSITISDTNVNSYTAAQTITFSSAFRYITYTAPNIAAGANTVTFAWPGATATPFIVAIHEYSGVATVSVVDASAQLGGNSTNYPLSPSVTTTVSGDMLHLLAGDQITNTLTQSGSYTQRETAVISTQATLYSWDKLAGAGGSYSNTVSGSATSFAGTILVALKGTGAAAGSLLINPGMDGGMHPQLKGGTNG